MEYYNQDEQQEGTTNKSLKGYKIVIIVLVLVLGAVSFQYFRQVNEIQEEFAIERDTLSNRIEALVTEYTYIQSENDTITESLNTERLKADSLLQRLKSERRWSASKVREYEQKVFVLRDAMKGYIHTIDSLNTINQDLVDQNVKYRKEVTTQKLRAEIAMEKSDELTTKISMGSVVRARDLKIVPLRGNDREVTRASRAERLRVDFVLSSNDLTNPGAREVYVRVTGPDGYILAKNSNDLFNHEGDMLTYSASREIDYKNKDLAVNVYYDGTGITSGKYQVEIYMDGHKIGDVEAIIK